MLQSCAVSSMELQRSYAVDRCVIAGFASATEHQNSGSRWALFVLEDTPLFFLKH
ncbi:hypothetical protein SOVF_156620 [Spinacia oleracea]|nr:hypothetical protein SOVF_156620 [Spinacia oleracea]